MCTMKIQILLLLLTSGKSVDTKFDKKLVFEYEISCKFSHPRQRLSY